jgi:GNAT superfamily N-acetyltransferase
MKTIIREATEVDLPSIHPLYARLGKDDGTVLSLEEARSILARMKTYPDYIIYVACNTGSLVGPFTLLIMDNIVHKEAPSAILEDNVVDEKLRDKGIDRQMMAYAGNLCREKGCYKMAFSSNPKREAAHRFYQLLGFEKHGYSFSISSSTTKTIC